MREITLNELDMVSGSGLWSDYVMPAAEVCLGVATATSAAAALVVFSGPIATFAGIVGIATGTYMIIDAGIDLCTNYINQLNAITDYSYAYQGS